jgi:2-dehydropantoate 2-reductase
MKIVFGELDGRTSERGTAFEALCRKAGFDVTLTSDIQTALWEKFVLLAVNSSVVSLIRLPFGKLREDPDVMGLFSSAFAEVIALGRRLDVKLPPDMQARMEKATRNFPPAMMPSMAVDLLRGNRLELPWLGGKVVELGKQLGMPTPVFSTMYAALKLYANGAPEKSA